MNEFIVKFDANFIPYDRYSQKTNIIYKLVQSLF